MGRVIKVRSGPSIPSQNTKMTFKMTKLVEEVECPKCGVAVEGLFWQNGETGKFDISSDIVEYIEVDWGA